MSNAKRRRGGRTIRSLDHDNPCFTGVEETAIRAEKAKARELRSSQWWRSKIAEGVCQYCGERFIPSELTMDHIVPLARGGKSVKANLAPACKACNTQKKATLPFDSLD